MQKKMRRAYRRVLDEYLKAYYEALLKRQKEQEEALRMQQGIDITQMQYDGVPETECQVGKKAKRQVYEEDNVEWEDAPTAGSGEKYILADLNMEVTASSRRRRRGRHRLGGRLRYSYHNEGN